MIYADDILNKPATSKPRLSDIATGTVTGAVLGLTAGILYAYFQNKKYIQSMMIGTLAGGLLSNIFQIKK